MPDRRTKESRELQERFGAALRLLRTSSGLGLRELARRLDVSPTYVSRVEAGFEPPPAPDRLLQLAEILGVAPDTLGELAGRVSPDLLDYLRAHPMALRLVRTLREVDAPDELLADLVRRVRLDGAGDPTRRLLDRIVTVPAWEGDLLEGVARALDRRLGVHGERALDDLRTRGLTTDASASSSVALAHVEAPELESLALVVVRGQRRERLVLALAYPPDAATRRAFAMGTLARLACDRRAIDALKRASDRSLTVVCRRELYRVLGLVPPSRRRPPGAPRSARRPA